MIVAMANMSTTVTKAAANGYSLNLGTAIWDDESHTTFKYPHAKIEGVGNEKIYSITVNIDNGTAKAITSDFNIPTYGSKGNTYIFNDGKTKDEVEEILKNLEFTSSNTGTMNVDVTISSNKTEGFNSSNVRDLLYNPTNGHYYMRTGVQKNWMEAYNLSKTYVFEGRKGYLLTLVYGDDEFNFLNNLGNYFSSLPHIGASKLKDKSGNVISDAEKIEASNLTLTRDASTDNIYYNCGPEAGGKYTINTPIAGQGDNDWECILIGFNYLGSGTFDEYYDNEPFHEIIVEFGGYAENQDPGGYSKEKKLVQVIKILPQWIQKPQLEVTDTHRSAKL